MIVLNSTALFVVENSTFAHEKYLLPIFWNITEIKPWKSRQKPPEWSGSEATRPDHSITRDTTPHHPRRPHKKPPSFTLYLHTVLGRCLQSGTRKRCYSGGNRKERWRREGRKGRAASSPKLMNSCPRRKRNNPLFRQFAPPYNLYWVSFADLPRRHFSSLLIWKLAHRTPRPLIPEIVTPLVERCAVRTAAKRNFFTAINYVRPTSPRTRNLKCTPRRRCNVKKG